MSTIGTGRSREGACVPLSATAEAKVFKSYDDVLKSGDKATIVAMQAALQKAGPGEAKLLDDGEPSVLVWFSGPPYYYPLETGGTLEADGLPSGGTFEWSCDPEATGESAWFPGDTAGHLTVTVTYHSGGESSTAQCDVTIFDGDVDMAGVVDADPPQEDPPGPDLDPGGMVGPMGPRRAITLTWDPNDLLPVDEAGDHHWWSAALSVQPVGKLQFWDAAVDGNEVTQLGWSGHHAPQWHGDTVPDTLYVAPVPAASGAAVHVTFTCGARCLPRSPTAYEDEVVLNLMEARLQALANDAQEEDPGVFLGVGGMKLMSILKPLPVAALHGTDLVKLSWTNGDKVHVWDDAQKTQAITNGQTFAISDLNEGTGFAQRDLYVEGVAASEGLRDIVFTLQYPAEDPITHDVVKFTVVQADLDVEGLNEVQEDDPGPLVGRRHDGNEAPRRKITLQKVLPEAWTGGVSLMALSPDDRLKVYDAAEGGNEVDVTGTGTSFLQQNLPVDLWVQGDVASATMRDAVLRLQTNGAGYAHDDVHFTVVDVDLEAPGVQESDEENPGVLLGVGATHALTVHDPQPSGHLPADSELQVSWTGDAYVDVWKDAGCTEAVGNPATFTLAELRAPGSPWTQLYVEGKDTSGQARDVSITLRYLHPAFQPEDQPIDVVNLTVLSTDLDISDIADGEEENPGAFLVRRHDGNGAPRVEIMLGAVPPVGRSRGTAMSCFRGLTARSRSSTRKKQAMRSPSMVRTTFSATLTSSPWLSTCGCRETWPVVLCSDTGLTLTPQGMNGGADAVKFTVADITDVAVHESDQETAEIPSVLGTDGLEHFVTAKDQGDVVLVATTQPDSPEVAAHVSWTAGGLNVTCPAVGGDKRTASFSSATQGGVKVPLTVLMDGAECRHAIGWVVWSENQLAEGGPEGGPFVETVTSLHTVLEAPPITVAQRILPEEIILTNQDVPDLRGARAVPPPDVPATDVTVYNHGVSLAAGADKRWDASRQVRLKVINPANLDFIVGRRFYVSQEAYPNDETCGNVGNDDPDILSGEEDNDPYTSPWPYRVTGWDSPMYTPLQAVGQTGDTFEVRAHFRILCQGQHR